MGSPPNSFLPLLLLCATGLAVRLHTRSANWRIPSRSRSPPLTAQLDEPPDYEWEHQMAPAKRLAEHIPGWAAQIMLDEEQRNEYMEAQIRARTSEYKPVSGRDWHGEESHGMEAFTPLEIAEDFNAPAESVMAKILEVGVPERDLRADRPLSEMCSSSQVGRRPL